MDDALVTGIVGAAFAGLLGYVLGNRSTQQLKIDMAAIAPTLAAIGERIKTIQVAVDSVAHGFVEHIRTAGHAGGLERLDDLAKDIDRLGEKVTRHVENPDIHEKRKA